MRGGGWDNPAPHLRVSARYNYFDPLYESATLASALFVSRCHAEDEKFAEVIPMKTIRLRFSAAVLGASTPPPWRTTRSRRNTM
jgi:hypothetical protein